MSSRAGALAIGAAVLVSLFYGCAHFRPTAPFPNERTLVLRQLVVHSDFQLSSDHRLLAELESLRGYVSDQLNLPPSGEPVQVYLYQDPREFRKFLAKRFPDLPDRRALFVENDTELIVYAQWGDRVAEDLRHEVTHGYLHAAVPNLPLWVDEGLAEYFEVARDQNGLNRAHLDQLRAELSKGTWHPDVKALSQIRSAQAMRQIDYAEAWAWIHYLLHSEPANRSLLQDYLRCSA